MRARNLFVALTRQDEAAEPVGRDEAQSGVIHLAALSFTKIADGLIDPKLVLAWLLTALGAPAAFIGALVPVREAGALLPQLALARPVERSGLRKTYWAAGSAVQGLAALGIALSALVLEGWAAGCAFLVCLAGLAVARAACSISHKDALARTIRKTRRGAVTGAASSVASAAVLGFGAALATGLIPLESGAVALAVAVAGGLWLGGAAVFLLLPEPAKEPGPGLAKPLREDPQLRRFIVARALLTATALAPPFLVMLAAADNARHIGQLGPLVLASAAASITSAYVWGRLSDRSSRQTLMASGALGALALGAAAGMGIVTGGLGGVAGSVCAVFAVQISYEGVRAGRKLHLTDMADDHARARYTALSNSLIGVVLVLGGALGVVANFLGPALTLAVFAALCAAAVPVAASLNEVQDPEQEAG